jgi:hypothetical protein
MAAAVEVAVEVVAVASALPWRWLEALSQGLLGQSEELQAKRRVAEGVPSSRMPRWLSSTSLRNSGTS